MTSTHKLPLYPEP